MTPLNDSHLIRVVLALEVPDCDCKILWGQFHTRECDRKRGKAACDCPVMILSPPCEHVLSADHDLDADNQQDLRWIELLETVLPEEYQEPPPPPAPEIAPTRQARVAVMVERARARMALRHPGDDWMGSGLGAELKVGRVSRVKGSDGKRRNARLRNGVVNPEDEIMFHQEKERDR
jgi:hypothetical protein